MDMRRVGKQDPAPRDQVPPAFVEALLRNPMRRRIVELLDRNPGLNKNQLAKALGIHGNALGFHLQRLEAARLVETRPGWRGHETLCFTPENARLWEDESTRVLFGRGPLRYVAAYLTEHPAAAVLEVSEALGLTVSTVRRHIRTLEDRDLVQRMRIDRQVIYHAEPELREWVKEVGGGVGDQLKP